MAWPSLAWVGEGGSPSLQPARPPFQPRWIEWERFGLAGEWVVVLTSWRLASISSYETDMLLVGIVKLLFVALGCGVVWVDGWVDTS